MEKQENEGRRSVTPPPRPIKKQMALKSTSRRHSLQPTDNSSIQRRSTRAITGVLDTSSLYRPSTRQSTAKNETPKAGKAEPPKPAKHEALKSAKPETPKSVKFDSSKEVNGASNPAKGETPKRATSKSSARQSTRKEKAVRPKATPKTDRIKDDNRKRRATNSPKPKPKRSRAHSEVYDVEEILDRRTNAAGEYEYLVKWIGFDHSQNTWEPRSNFDSELLVGPYDRYMEIKALEKETINGPSNAHEAVADILHDLETISTSKEEALEETSDMKQVVTPVEAKLEAPVESSRAEKSEGKAIATRIDVIPKAEFDFSVRYDASIENSTSNTIKDKTQDKPLKILGIKTAHGKDDKLELLAMVKKCGNKAVYMRTSAIANSHPMDLINFLVERIVETCEANKSGHSITVENNGETDKF